MRWLPWRDGGDSRGGETDVLRLQKTAAKLEGQIEALTRSVQQQQQQPAESYPASDTLAANSTRDVVITMLGNLGFGVGSRFVRSLRETGSKCDVILMMPDQVCAGLLSS